MQKCHIDKITFTPYLYLHIYRILIKPSDIECHSTSTSTHTHISWIAIGQRTKNKLENKWLKVLLPRLLGQDRAKCVHKTSKQCNDTPKYCAQPIPKKKCPFTMLWITIESCTNYQTDVNRLFIVIPLWHKSSNGFYLVNNHILTIIITFLRVPISVKKEKK